MNELLALLGLAWPRLMLYPGGLFALTLVSLWQLADTRHATAPRPQTGVWPSYKYLFPVPRSPLPMLNAVPPLLAISLLPLPLAASLGRGIDLVLALTLLEWPLFVRLSSHTSTLDDHDLQRLKAGYALLLPALLSLVQSTRSFALEALVVRPGTLETLATLLRLGGVCGWALALVPLLAIGPFRQEQAPELDDNIRTVGHVLLATLPVLALLGEWWLAPLAPLALGLLLCAADRYTTGRARLWQHVLTGATSLLWLLLAWASFDALLARAL